MLIELAELLLLETLLLLDDTELDELDWLDEDDTLWLDEDEDKSSTAMILNGPESNCAVDALGVVKWNTESLPAEPSAAVSVRIARYRK